MTINAIDILLSKAVDGIATQEEWAYIQDEATLDPSIWKRLADLTRLQSQLGNALEETLETAGTVELDMNRAHNHHSLSIHVRKWSGWAVAAILALAVVGTKFGLLTPVSNSGLNAGWLSADASPEEALEQYRTVGTINGRIVSELPTLFVDVRVDPQTGQQEMFYLRRFLERVAVDGMYTSDPQGQDVVPVLVPVSSSNTDTREY
jgi:hypothetical protein